MKTFLESKGIYFPSTTDLLEGRKALRPVISSILDGKGVAVDYKDLVRRTAESQVQLLIDEIKEKNDEEKEELQFPSNLKMILKDGCDGAGQQVAWKSKSMIEAAENMFQYGLVPLHSGPRMAKVRMNSIS